MSFSQGKLFPFIFAALAMLSPSLAEAHSAGLDVNGWSDGFNHPLHGWDHLLVMVAVGVWAAQQRGRAGWLIPLTFVTVMATLMSRPRRATNGCPLSPGSLTRATRPSWRLVRYRMP
jgi:hypothetical protein